jgi:hypothetical protein
MRLRLRAAFGLEPPKRGGPPPRVAGLFALLALTLAAACEGDGADQVTSPVALGMTSSINPYYSDGELTLYQVETPVALPVRKPTQAEEKALGPAPKGTPYPHAPFLTAQDESVEVHFVLSNVDDTTHNVWLLIDPWNEFVRWKPGVTVVSDEETIPNNGYDQEFVLPPKSRVEGTITSDDMQEIATKLASVETFLASPQAMQTDGGTTDNSLDPTEVCNNIFDYQNRSNDVPPDPIYAPWIPPVIAGVTGFDLGLRLEGGEDDATPAADGGAPVTAQADAGSAANIAVEITMEVQDLNGNRFVPQDTNEPELGVPPKVLSPPSARF